MVFIADEITHAEKPNKSTKQPWRSEHSKAAGYKVHFKTDGVSTQ